MSPAGWLALAVAFAVTTVPSGSTLRAADLGRAGRLGGTRARRRHVRWGVDRVTPVAVMAAVPPVGWVLWAGGPALGLAAAVGCAVGGVLVNDVFVQRRDVRRRRDLLTAVRVLSGELEAGARPDDALLAAAATSEAAGLALGPAVAACRDGGDASAALAASPDTGIRRLAVAWRLAAVTGAALAAAVDRVAADLADADDRHRTVGIALSGPRSSAVLLSGLPLVGIALGAAMGAHPLAFLWSDPAGGVVCCVGVLLDAAGILWIRRIVRRAAR